MHLRRQQGRKQFRAAVYPEFGRTLLRCVTIVPAETPIASARS